MQAPYKFATYSSDNTCKVKNCISESAKRQSRSKFYYIVKVIRRNIRKAKEDGLLSKCQERQETKNATKVAKPQGFFSLFLYINPKVEIYQASGTEPW